jgi:hypothetical protein
LICLSGTAIYIYGILPPQLQDVTTLVDLRFLLDGEPVSSYRHEPGSADEYEYDVNFYANGSIPDGPHELILQPMAQPNQSVLLFDYAIVRCVRSLAYFRIA